MERRKVQLVGGTTLSVTLPKKWASSVGLRMGDSVDLDPQFDGALLVRPCRPPGAVQLNARRLNAEKLTAAQVEGRLVAYYLGGADAIEVYADSALDPSVVHAVESIPRRLTGLEIVDQNAQRILLQDLLDPSEVNVARALQRLYGLASGIHRDVLAALSHGDPGRLDDVEARHHDLERLSSVATRQLRLVVRGRLPTPEGGREAHDTLTFASGIGLIQRLGLYGTRLAGAARLVLKRPVDPRVIPGLVEVGTRSIGLCDLAARSLTSGSLPAAEEALGRVHGFEARRADIQGFAAACALEDRTCEACLGCIQILEWFQATALLGARLAELGVQRAVALEELGLPSALPTDSRGLARNGEGSAGNSVTPPALVGRGDPDAAGSGTRSH